MDRKQAIRALIKHYIKLEDKHPNKKELKDALKYELSELIKEDEDKITDYLLNDWIENERRTELEEDLAKDFGLPPHNPDEDKVVFKLPKLDTK